jgi:hypothetical protein
MPKQGDAMRTQGEFIPAGQDPQALAIGDLLFVSHPGLAPRLIRFRQRLYYPEKYAKWNHVACVASRDGDLVEALAKKGVVRSSVSKYRNTKCLLVHTHLNATDQAQADGFLNACVGQEYAWWSDLTVGFPLPPGHVLQFGLPGTQFCSGLAAAMLTRGWAVFPDEPGAMLPAGLVKYYDKEKP